MIENLESFDSKKDTNKEKKNKANKKRKYSNNKVSDGKSSQGTEIGNIMPVPWYVRPQYQ